MYRNGAPGAIRTPDPLIRSQVLYPAELRVRLALGYAHGPAVRNAMNSELQVRFRTHDAVNYAHTHC